MNPGPRYLFDFCFDVLKHYLCWLSAQGGAGTPRLVMGSLEDTLLRYGHSAISPHKIGG